jgi:hypothetical protein
VVTLDILPENTLYTGSVYVEGTILTTTGEFAVAFKDGRNSFQLVSIDQGAPVPVLSATRFNADGSAIGVYFSFDTDRAGMTAAYFDCALLFSFAGMADATCQWASNANVVIRVASDSTLVVGSSLSLIPAPGHLNAACAASQTSCATVAAATLAIGAPDDAFTPVADIAASDNVPVGSEFTVDISHSVGHGGRKWQSVTFTITGAQPADSAAVESFLNAYFGGNPDSLFWLPRW